MGRLPRYLLTRSGADPFSLIDGASLPAVRRTVPSVFAAMGIDRKLGTRRASLRMEMRVSSIGAQLQTAVGLGLQLHVP